MIFANTAGYGQMVRNQAPGALLIWRQHLVLAGMISVFVVLALRVVYLQTHEREKLQSQGEMRYLREVKIFPERGRILDRNGQPLSVSTPVYSLVSNPGLFCNAELSWDKILETTGTSRQDLKEKCEKFVSADFMYIKRQLPPSVVEQAVETPIPGLQVRREYKRYFPGGPISAHLIGFTDIDGNGLEGLEKAFNEELKGSEGRMHMLKSLGGRFVERVSVQQVQHGKDIMISIDQRLQSLASQYLESALIAHDAAGGSVVVLSIPSGEILAMVNAPHFNPNDRNSLKDRIFRNRAVTDVLEPGSTIKPFTIAMALDSRTVGVDTMVDTSPGTYQIGGSTIRDVHDYGELSVFDVIVRSSNIGSAKIALSLPFDDLFDTLQEVGFGSTAGFLPGEIPGLLKRRSRKIEHASMAYGYGFSVTPLQLARAYTVFATDGVLLPVTLEKKEPGFRARGKRVFGLETVLNIRNMLEQVATPKGTARKARIARYRIGGKTGTTHKLIDGKYAKNRYVSLFAGFGPVSDPKFLTVVSIDDPKGKYYYGGDVAAPVFSRLMSDMMRLYNVRPDDVDQSRVVSIQFDKTRV